MYFIVNHIIFMALINISNFSNAIDIGNQVEIKFKLKNSLINKMPKFLQNEYEKENKYIFKLKELINKLALTKKCSHPFIKD